MRARPPINTEYAFSKPSSIRVPGDGIVIRMIDRSRGLPSLIQHKEAMTASVSAAYEINAVLGIKVIGDYVYYFSTMRDHHY